MLHLLIFIDFVFFIFIYISSKWIGWIPDQALSSKSGFALLAFSAFLIAKNGFTKPLKIGKLLTVVGIIILLISFAVSLQIRKSQNFIVVEKERFNQSKESIALDKVIVRDSPGIVRNDVFAKLLIGDEKETVKIMPRILSDRYFWRIVRFGYAPVLSLTVKNKEEAKNQSLVLATENWTSNAETIITEAGFTRKPPPRIMLGVGAFPPEMEALVNLNQFDRTGENIFIRLSKTTFKGEPVSLEGDDYWRYLVNGRLRDPVLKIGLIKNKKLTKIQEVKIGDLLKWNNNSIRFDDLKYWVEIERRWDPFIPVIIASFFITYLGIGITAIQHIMKKVKNVFKNFI